MDEITYLVKEFGIDHIHFADDTFNMNVPRAKEICQRIIDCDLDIKFRVMARADIMDEELINLLKKAGCYEIDFGVETGSLGIMQNRSRRLDLSMVEKTFGKCKEVGIQVLAYFMVGLPREREVDIQRTIDFIKKPEIDLVDVTIASILPGTELCRRAESSGLIHSSIWFTYSSPNGINKDTPPYLEYYSVAKLNYFVKLMNYEAWKKRGLIFYYQKKIKTLFASSVLKLIRSSVLLTFLWEEVKKLKRKKDRGKRVSN